MLTRSKNRNHSAIISEALSLAIQRLVTCKIPNTNPVIIAFLKSLKLFRANRTTLPMNCLQLEVKFLDSLLWWRQLKSLKFQCSMISYHNKSWRMLVSSSNKGKYLISNSAACLNITGTKSQHLARFKVSETSLSKGMRFKRQPCRNKKISCLRSRILDYGKFTTGTSLRSRR